MNLSELLAHKDQCELVAIEKARAPRSATTDGTAWYAVRLKVDEDLLRHLLAAGLIER